MSLTVARVISYSLVILFGFSLVISAQAEILSTGNPRKGGYVFRKCIACHKNNNTPVVCPGDKSKKFWDFYTSDYFDKCRKVQSENNFEKYKFTPTQLTHLLSFLHKYAKDSDEKLLSCP